jgi:hypothetical protein
VEAKCRKRLLNANQFLATYKVTGGESAQAMLRYKKYNKDYV